MMVPVLWAAILGGPSHGEVTAGGEGESLLWAGAVRAHGLADFCPHALKGMFAAAGCPLCEPLVTT